MAEEFQESRCEKRCAELEGMARSAAEQEELEFLKDYLRDKPRLDIERMKSRGKLLSPGNTAGDVARALQSIKPAQDEGRSRADLAD